MAHDNGVGSTDNYNTRRCHCRYWYCGLRLLCSGPSLSVWGIRTNFRTSINRRKPSPCAIQPEPRCDKKSPKALLCCELTTCLNLQLFSPHLHSVIYLSLCIYKKTKQKKTDSNQVFAQYLKSDKNICHVWKEGVRGCKKKREPSELGHIWIDVLWFMNKRNKFFTYSYSAKVDKNISMRDLNKSAVIFLENRIPLFFIASNFFQYSYILIR